MPAQRLISPHSERYAAVGGGPCAIRYTRSMKRFGPIVACAAAVAVACFASAGNSHATESAFTPQAQRVTVVLAPYLVWDDLTTTSTPTLLRLAENGAIGAANVRARVRAPGGVPSPTESALCISAGAWALPSSDALASFVATESYEGSGTAAEAYRRVFGAALGSARIGYLGLPQVQRFNESESTDAFVGVLGQAVADAGGLTAAVGNSDVGYPDTTIRFERPAAVVGADLEGRVNAGDVSADLLTESVASPYGRRTDLVRFADALQRVNQLTSSHRGPSLVVLDPGDMTRAREFASRATTGSAQAQRVAALRTLDAVVALAAKSAGDDGVVIVVSQALNTNQDGDPEGLGPCIVSGPGWSGYLTSASTHRAGIVTNLDVTATVLEQLGIVRPVEVLGNPMSAVAGPAAIGERVDHLQGMNVAATSIEIAKGSVLNLYIGFAVVLLIIAAFVVSRAHLWHAATARRIAAIVQGAVLLVLAIPVSSWIMFIVIRYPASAVVAVLTLLGVALVLWLIALALWRSSGPRIPVIALMALTVLVILVEQYFGAPLSFVSFFGYSPLPAARFYGMGNEAASILFGASLAGLALVLDEWRDASWAPAARRYGIAVLGVLVVGTAAAPFFGANVGVAIWGAVGYGLAWMLMNGRRVTWRTVVIMLVGVVLLIGAFAAIDLLGGGEQTHLGRSLSSAEQGGVGELWTIAVRKAETNMRVFTRTNWSWVLIAVLAFLAFMRFRPKGDFADTLAENPRYADAITVTLVAGALAFFTEDSGIVIPALIMLYTGAGIMWLMLVRLGDRDEGSA